MKNGIAFLAILAGGFAAACLGVGLVISAFARGKPTKAGIVRAIIGGVLVAICVTMSCIYLN